MAYATVEDVQQRTGVVFSAPVADQIEVFIEDFSEEVDAELERAGLDPAIFPDSTHRRIVAQRAASYYFSQGARGGLTSHSTMVGDVMETKSYSRKGKRDIDFAYDYSLTANERKAYGLGMFIGTLEFDCE